MLEYLGSWHSVQKFIRPINNLLDAIPCHVKAEHISNCNSATKAEYISDVGSKRGIRGISTGCEIWHLTPKDCAPIFNSSILASVKSTNVNEKLAQTIVPSTVKCSLIVSWQREL